MSEFWHAAILWTAQSTVAGGAALLLGWLAARRVADPARRHRAMAWSVRAAVLACGLALLPGWWKLVVPGWRQTPEDRAAEVARVEFEEAEPTIRPTEEVALVPVEVDVSKPTVLEPVMELSFEHDKETMAAAVPNEEPRAAATEMMAEIAPVVLIPYWLIVAFAVARQIVGHVGLMRLCRSAAPANERVERMACGLVGDRAMPRILVSDRLASPVCFGVFQPTILLPRSLVKSATDDQLYWVLAHELDHLRRGDPRTGVWVGLARALYFPVPWFWAIRREIDLAQEYLADAAAAGARTADYAAFLVELSSRPGVSRFVRAVPSLAGVRAGQSDLYRRVTMLLETNGGRKTRGGRAWTTLAIAGAVSAAVALSGVRLTADEPKKGDKKLDGEKRVEVIVRDKNDKNDKKPDGGKKPDVVHDVEVIVVVDHSKELAEIEKSIEEAAKKGDVDGVKKLVAKLKALTAGPQIARFKPPVPPVPPLPPGAKNENIPVEALQKARIVRMTDLDETKKLEEAIAKLKKAIDEVKDQPEAKAALEKTMAEYRKKIEEAHAKGHFKFAEAAKGQQQFQFRIDGAAAAQDQIRKQVEEVMKSYQKQIESLKGDEKATAALKEAMAKYKESMEVLQKQMSNLPKMDQFQWQGVPKVAVADGRKMLEWTGKGAASDKGRLGVTIEAVPAVIVEQLDLPKGQGVIIAHVIEGTPAAKAGLKANDIVLEVAGKAVTIEDLPKVLEGLKNDEAFEVIVIRKGKKDTVKGVTIPSPAKSPSKESKDGVKKSSQSSMSVSVKNDQFEIKSEQDGLKYELKGTVGDPNSVEIEIEKDRKKFFDGKGVKSVPAEHREKVAELLKSVGGNK